MEPLIVVVVTVIIVGEYVWAMVLRDKNIRLSSEKADLKQQYDYTQGECARLRNENTILRGGYMSKKEGGA
jgi:hypothetical protein